MSSADTYKFDELTWPEVNECVEMGKIPILPTGSVEQHGHHLPLKVDHLCANAVATEAARLKPSKALVLPPVTYGYVHHVMDFPGSLNIHYEHFIQYCLDITKSLAYHGFKKIILVNGHGSNHNLVDMVARRTIVETDASCVFCSWWQLLKVNPDFDKQWRESVFPGG
ncbi:MAG TPA: creatininase, partial [Candidatus Latescibacteria bacterium]|nr:creatininase [Candidatus Latescibacterota bacterium]